MPMFKKIFVSVLTILCLSPVSGTTQEALSIPQGLVGQVSRQLMNEMKPLDKPLHLKICIFDILGKAGPVYSIAQDIALEARKWNVFAELVAHTNETVAT